MSNVDLWSMGGAKTKKICGRGSFEGGGAGGAWI